MVRVFCCLVFFPVLFSITAAQSRAEEAAKPDSEGMEVIFNGKDLKG